MKPHRIVNLLRAAARSGRIVVGRPVFGSQVLASIRFNPCFASATAASQSGTQRFTVRIEFRHRPVSTAQSVDFTLAYPEISQRAFA